TKKFTKVLFLADGAEVPWNLVRSSFPTLRSASTGFTSSRSSATHERRFCRGTRRQLEELEGGVIEGAVRNLVGVRLDGPGMRWGRDRTEAILHLRCVLLNGQR